MENKYEISYVKNNVPQANIYIAESEELAEKFFKSTRPDCLYAGIRKTNTVKPGQPVIEVPLWLLKISYSWGDEEADQKFCSFEDAWKAATDIDDYYMTVKVIKNKYSRQNCVGNYFPYVNDVIKYPLTALPIMYEVAE